MTGFERISAAMQNKQNDKVPIMLHNFMMAAAEAGVSMKEFRENSKTIRDVFVSSIDKYAYDGIMIDVDTVTLAGALGVPIDFPINDPARTHQGLIQSLDEIRKLPSPNIEHYPQVNIWLEGVRLLKEYFGNEIYIRGNCDQAPFSLASMLRGSQNWMIDLLMVEKELIEETLAYCAQAGVQFIKLMAQTGCDMVSNGDSPAGPDMISDEMYRTYAMPYEKILVDAAHDEGLPYGLHICGNTEIILNDMIETGTDALELDYLTDIHKVFQACQGKVTMIGNIDPSGVLANGSVKEVVEATEALMSVYGNSNDFILNAGCAIPPTTPSKNLRAMINTAHSFR